MKMHIIAFSINFRILIKRFLIGLIVCQLSQLRAYQGKICLLHHLHKQKLIKLSAAFTYMHNCTNTTCLQPKSAFEGKKHLPKSKHALKYLYCIFCFLYFCMSDADARKSSGYGCASGST